eukprot:980264-Amphidinium_carterae.1
MREQLHVTALCLQGEIQHPPGVDMTTAKSTPPAPRFMYEGFSLVCWFCGKIDGIGHRIAMATRCMAFGSQAEVSF